MDSYHRGSFDELALVHRGHRGVIDRGGRTWRRKDNSLQFLSQCPSPRRALMSPLLARHSPNAQRNDELERAFEAETPDRCASKDAIASNLVATHYAIARFVPLDYADDSTKKHNQNEETLNSSLPFSMIVEL